MVLPVLTALALALAWVLSLAGTHVRAVDAAREVARAAARGESRSAAIALGRQVAPDGATISVREGGRQLVVAVTASVRPVAGLLSFLPPVHVDARAVAAKEPGT